MHEYQDLFQYNTKSVEQDYYRVFDINWRGKILQWFTAEDVALSQKEALIEHLINFKDDCGGYFRYRAFFLAAEAIALFKPSQHAESIVKQLLQWSYHFCRDSKHTWGVPPEWLEIEARDCLKRTDLDSVVQQLTNYVQTADQLNTLHAAAKHLGLIDPGNRCAIAALEKIAKCFHQPARKRFRAAQSLFLIDDCHPSIVPTLIELVDIVLTADPIQEKLLLEIIRQLEKAKTKHSTIISCLSQIIHQFCKRDMSLLHVKVQIAETLGVIGLGNKIAIVTLIKMITQEEPVPEAFSSPHDYASHWAPVRALRKIAKHHPDAIDSLSSVLAAVDNDFLRSHIAGALLNIDPGNTEAIAQLIPLLQTTQSKLTNLLELQAAGIKYVEGTNLRTWTLISSERAMLWRICEALAINDPSYQPAIDGLLQLVPLCVFDIGISSLPILASLDLVDPTREISKEALTDFIKAHPNCEGSETLWLLSNADAQNPAVINGLTQMIHDGHCVVSAARYLHSIQPENTLVIDTLLQLAKDTDADIEEQKIREIAMALGCIAPDDERILPTLVRFAQYKHESSEYDNFCSIAKPFRKISSTADLQDAMRSLKPYLYRENLPEREEGKATFSFSADHWRHLGRNRYELCDHIFWNCSQNMSYRDFHAAWHSPSSGNSLAGSE